VKYLSFILGHSCIKVDPECVKTITNWPTPTNAHKLRQFLGISNTIQSFVK
ncbi:hypothetical protein BJ742DRAFT_664650, partial [Cladochytrium replicatum]